MDNKSNKDWLVTLLLSIFLGGFSAHRFYAGKIGTALLQIVTFGGFGFWLLYDIVMIAIGKFEDNQGRLIKRN